MTTIAFLPNALIGFQFQATLDGNSYQCSVSWNIAAQRWYITIYDSGGNVVVCRSLVASTIQNPINLVYGYFFTSTLVFYDSTQTFVITP